jgi:transposase InsO family protein
VAVRLVVARFGLEHVAVQESLSGGPRAAHRMREIAETKWHYGCFGVYVRLLREGWRVNHKKVERIDSEEGLSLRRRVRKKAITVPPRHVVAAHRVRGTVVQWTLSMTGWPRVAAQVLHDDQSLFKEGASD